MELKHEQRGKYLLVFTAGRLDASWADYFRDEMLKHIRNGQHDIVLDGSELVFLSSAGIRSILQVFKELKTVQGSFLIVNATHFVKQTLKTSGFDLWLGEKIPQDMPAEASVGTEDKAGIIHEILNEEYRFYPDTFILNKPWDIIDTEKIQNVSFRKDIIALGIGSSAATPGESKDQYGEFLSVCGNVVYQPPEESGHPDFLIAEKDYIPSMYCLQVLSFSGEPKHLIRFSPVEKVPFYPISVLLKKMLKFTNGKKTGFVIMGEIEGLVGSYLVRSPGILKAEGIPEFPEIRNWLSFTGERSYAHQEALIVGIVSGADDPSLSGLLPPMPGNPDIFAHMHAVVFPYQPLQNGNIPLDPTVRKFFNGPPPTAVLHLTDDARPVVGLGESAMISGACWFGTLDEKEVRL